MVKRIIDDLNGGLYFTTELGIGTTFYVSIPLLKQKV
jgi:signal transduction histidine kinase